jgi:hypothetical protein
MYAVGQAFVAKSERQARGSVGTDDSLITVDG